MTDTRKEGPPDLAALAEMGLEMAAETMRRRGQLHPSQVYAVDGDQNLYVIDFKIEQSQVMKDISALALRKFLQERKVDRYVLVTEVWWKEVSVKAEQDRQAIVDRIMERGVSEEPDRMEAIVAVGQDRQGTIEIIRPILRTEDGKFNGLGPAVDMGPGEGFNEGRFANMLPRNALQ